MSHCHQVTSLTETQSVERSTVSITAFVKSLQSTTLLQILRYFLLFDADQVFQKKLHHLVRVIHLQISCLALFSNFWRRTRPCHFFPMFLHLLTTLPSSTKLKALLFSLDLTIVSCIFYASMPPLVPFFGGIKKTSVPSSRASLPCTSLTTSLLTLHTLLHHLLRV